MNDDNPKPATPERKLYAVFSQTQKASYGSFIYSRPDGSETEVTCIESVEGCPQCAFPDKVDRGEVVKYVRGGGGGKVPLPKEHQIIGGDFKELDRSWRLIAKGRMLNE